MSRSRTGQWRPSISSPNATLPRSRAGGSDAANQWYDRCCVVSMTRSSSSRPPVHFCSPQGNLATLRVPIPMSRKVLHLMGRLGGMLSADLRAMLPALFHESYAPESAVACSPLASPPDFAPPLARFQRAVIEEWPSEPRLRCARPVCPRRALFGIMSQDQSTASIPNRHARVVVDPPATSRSRLRFRHRLPPDVPTANAPSAPHSLQVAPDGSI